MLGCPLQVLDSEEEQELQEVFEGIWVAWCV